MKKHTKNKSIRITDNIYEIAKKEDEKNNRSVASQIDFWCKIGILAEKKLSKIETEEIIQQFMMIQDSSSV